MAATIAALFRYRSDLTGSGEVDVTDTLVFVIARRGTAAAATRLPRRSPAMYTNAIKEGPKCSNFIRTALGDVFGRGRDQVDGHLSNKKRATS